MATMRKNTRIILSIVLLAVFAASAILAATAMGKSKGSSPADACGGIVYVLESTYVQGGLAGRGSGTGWAVGKAGEPIQYIVTNGHVVENTYIVNTESDARSAGYETELRVYFSDAENDYVIAQVVFYSSPEDKDIAILKLPSPTDKRKPLVLRRSDEVVSGEDAYALGFPGVSDTLQTDIRRDVGDVTITKGVISKRVTTVGSTYEAFQMDVAINPGNSGGPLVDGQGFVLGVNTAGLKMNMGQGAPSLEMGVNYASIADHVIRILEDERIAFEVKGQHSWMLYVFIPVGLIALALALLLLLKKPALAADGSPAGGSPAGRRGRQAADKNGPAGTRPVLRGVNGKFAGEKFGLGSARLTLGRDSAKCNIVFDADTPGISSNHCSVFYEAASDSFLLTDNGSSYGTFLGNGKKLTANVSERLIAGDSFYLADTGNRFIVTKE